MNLSFFTNCFGRSVKLSSSFAKTLSYVRDACKWKDKVYQANIYKKTTLVPVGFLMALNIGLLL